MPAVAMTASPSGTYFSFKLGTYNMETLLSINCQLIVLGGLGGNIGLSIILASFFVFLNKPFGSGFRGKTAGWTIVTLCPLATKLLAYSYTTLNPPTGSKGNEGKTKVILTSITTPYLAIVERILKPCLCPP